MALTEALQLGVISSLVQNQIYALPPVRAILYCDTAITFLQSNTVAFTASTAVTLTEGKYIDVSGGFIKPTSAAPINITLKRA